MDSVVGLGIVVGFIAMGCDPCEAPVNADLTVQVALASGVSPAGTLYLAATDASGTNLTNRQEAVDRLSFPYELTWTGNCDEGQMPPGLYTVTAWLGEEYLAAPFAPGPTDPQGSDQVEIVASGSGLRAVNELFITIALP